jgi:hypothetical protein
MTIAELVYAIDRERDGGDYISIADGNDEIIAELRTDCFLLDLIGDKEIDGLEALKKGMHKVWLKGVE